MYRDASQDASVHDLLPEVASSEAALRDLGFEPFAVVHAAAPGGGSWMFSARDRAFFGEIAARGAVFRAFVHAATGALAWHEKTVGGPVLVLRTALDDGRLLQTSQRPARAPDLTLATCLLALSPHRAWGPAGIWSRRFAHRFAESGPAEQVAAHQAWVAEEGTAVPPTLEAFLGDCTRVQRLTVRSGMVPVLGALLLVNLVCWLGR